MNPSWQLLTRDGESLRPLWTLRRQQAGITRFQSQTVKTPEAKPKVGPTNPPEGLIFSNQRLCRLAPERELPRRFRASKLG
jgi:hypothetical protein